MRALLKIIDNISYWTGKIAGLLVIPLTVVMCYTVVSRKFFSSATDWGFDVSIFIFGIFIMIAGAEVLRVKGHINVDIIPRLLPKNPQIILKIFSTLIIMIVCLVMIKQGYKLALNSTLISERSAHQTVFNPPVWWFKWFIPISAGLVFLQAIAQLIREIYELLGREIQQ